MDLFTFSISTKKARYNCLQEALQSPTPKQNISCHYDGTHCSIFGRFECCRFPAKTKAIDKMECFSK